MSVDEKQFKSATTLLTKIDWYWVLILCRHLLKIIDNSQ